MGNRNLTGKTKLCGLIGDPVEHTMSPAMHNAAFAKMGLDFVYVPFRVKPEDLTQAVAGMKALNIRGLNVTIPHKVAIISLLDELDSLAEKIGAVNTVVNDSGILQGFNTDAIGFLEALTQRGVEPKGKRVVVLGAGGAGRAASFVLAERGAHLLILNRRQELGWAEELAGQLTQAFGQEVRAMELTDGNLAQALEGAYILVNATSVGMTPNTDETPVSADMLRPSLVVFDVVYNPVKTKLMRQAEQIGAQTISGLEMLVWQGALAFELWTGAKPPVELMRKEVMRSLGQDEN
ncbi:shikimate dehydrogenase [Bacteroidota bacterium]